MDIGMYAKHAYYSSRFYSKFVVDRFDRLTLQSKPAASYSDPHPHQSDATQRRSTEQTLTSSMNHPGGNAKLLATQSIGLIRP